MNNWYNSNTSGNQSLVIDEATGANIAVCYDKAHGPLITQAPAMLDALRALVEHGRTARDECNIIGDYAAPYVGRLTGAINAAQSIIADIEFRA